MRSGNHDVINYSIALHLLPSLALIGLSSSGTIVPNLVEKVGSRYLIILAKFYIRLP